MAFPNDPPPDYRTPPFPSLSIHALSDPTPQRQYTLYHIADVWRFTLVWTLIAYAIFHVGAVLIAVFTHGWKRSSWRYLWAVPVVYLVTAGLEALLAGSVVGLVLGAVYWAGYYEMNTWIPFTWGSSTSSSSLYRPFPSKAGCSAVGTTMYGKTAAAMDRKPGGDGQSPGVSGDAERQNHGWSSLGPT